MSKEENFSEETLEHIANLALLEISEEEKKKLARQLKEILNYFKKLNDINTSDVKPMTHPIDGLKNVFREDIPGKSLSNEDALKNAKYTKNGYFKTSKVVKK